MNYELANELKDAGFPQVRRDATLPADDGGIVPLSIPTLSELIEACGEDFIRLERNYREYASKVWDWVAEGKGKRMIDGGSTPEEAVARLWLALNKKGS